MKSKLDLKKIILISMITASIELIWMIYNSYVPIFLQAGNSAFVTAETAAILGFGLGPAITGVIMTLDNLASLFIAPLIGIISDGTRSKLGRRMPFILAGAPLTVLSLFLIPMIPQWIPAASNGVTANLTGLLVAFIIALLFLILPLAVMTGPATVLIFDITKSEHRSTANGVNGVIAGLIVVIGTLGGSALYALYAPLPFWIPAILLLLSTLAVWVFIKESKTKSDGSSISDESITIRSAIHAIRTLPKENASSLRYLCSSILFSYLGLSILQAFISSYAVSSLGAPMSMATSLLAIFALVFLVVSIPAALLANKIGRKKTQIIGLAVFALACILEFLLPGETMVMIVMGLVGVGWGLANITMVPMFIDSAPSEGMFGTFLGINQLMVRISMIVGPIVGGWIVQMFNGNYNLIWVMVPVCLALAAFVIIPAQKGEIIGKNQEDENSIASTATEENVA